MPIKYATLYSLCADLSVLNDLRLLVFACTSLLLNCLCLVTRDR